MKVDNKFVKVSTLANANKGKTPAAKRFPTKATKTIAKKLQSKKIK